MKVYNLYLMVSYYRTDVIALPMKRHRMSEAHQIVLLHSAMLLVSTAIKCIINACFAFHSFTTVSVYYLFTLFIQRGISNVAIIEGTQLLQLDNIVIHDNY